MTWSVGSSASLAHRVWCEPPMILCWVLPVRSYVFLSLFYSLAPFIFIFYDFFFFSFGLPFDSLNIYFPSFRPKFSYSRDKRERFYRDRRTENVASCCRKGAGGRYGYGYWAGDASGLHCGNIDRWLVLRRYWPTEYSLHISMLRISTASRAGYGVELE